MRFVLTLAVVPAIVTVAPAASLRVANWNLANHPNDATDEQELGTILSYAGGSNPIDLLTMAETDTGSAPTTAADFGSTFGGAYASLVAPADGGGDRTGFVYNTSTLSLIGTSTIGVGTLTHPALRAQFRPVGTTGGDDLYVYAVHLRSGSSSTIKNGRVTEAAALRADADKLGDANVIVAGDFNWQKADDVSAGVGAYRTLAAAGAGQVVDPLNLVGDWHGNAAYKALFTEDPDTNMDDRFDMQLTSGELRDGRGLDYRTGSYRVVGNEGNVAPGGTIQASATLPANVVAAFGSFSDHLPVLADYDYRVPGDADGDDDVDFNDFLILQTNFGQTGAAFANSDFNYDGVTNFNDFLILQSGFGTALDGPATTSVEQMATITSFARSAVPEPSATVILLTAWPLTIRRRRYVPKSLLKNRDSVPPAATACNGLARIETHR